MGYFSYFRVCEKPKEKYMFRAQITVEQRPQLKILLFKHHPDARMIRAKDV